MRQIDLESFPSFCLIFSSQIKNHLGIQSVLLSFFLHYYKKKYDVNATKQISKKCSLLLIRFNSKIHLGESNFLKKKGWLVKVLLIIIPAFVF